MKRAHIKIGLCFFISLFLLHASSCSKAVDDERLSPEKRAERFEKYIEDGMDWKELAKAFKPGTYRIVVPRNSSAEDLFSGLGNEKKKFDEAEFAKELAAAPNFDTFYFEYTWLAKPHVSHEVAFGKDGKVRNYSRVGNFD